MSAEMKRMIAETLHQLLRKKPLDKITVKELADCCHISRQTFYYHFQDIMQVVEWDQDRVLNEVVQKSLSAADAREAVDVLVCQVFSHKELIENLLTSQHSETIRQLWVQAVYQYLKNSLVHNSSELKLAPVDVDYILHFYSCGLVGLMLQDLKQKNPDIEVIKNKIYRILNGELHLTFM